MRPRSPSNPRPKDGAGRTLSAIIGLLGGSLFGAVAVLFRMSDEWSQITSELVQGVVVLALWVLAQVAAELGGSLPLAALSSWLAFTGGGVLWSRDHGGESQFGLNLALGAVWATLCVCAMLLTKLLTKRRSSGRAPRNPRSSAG